MPVTFVTSFYDIYNGDLNAQKTIEWRVERFNEIAGTGINICVYTCPKFAKYIDTVKYPNLYLVAGAAATGAATSEAGVATSSLAPRTPPADCHVAGSASDNMLAGGVRGAAAPVSGFYVGGMKQKDLDITETKQVVLATYAMAAEALDIKTLSTLVMATPKTDITQSVGRILRMKHANPRIVDIIDTHSTFQNQWKLRKRFYKKANYKIVTTTSTKYNDMMDMDSDTWFTAFDPKNTKECDVKEKEKDDDELGGKCCIDMSGL
jgi:hypothetical protein